MKRLKKTIAVLTTAVMIATLGACGTSQQTTNLEDIGETSTVEETIEEDVEDVIDITNTYQADVVVVGAGGAGLTAAIKAAEAGASVVILEKSSSVGGNTIATQSGMTAAETDVQKEAGIEFSIEDLIEIQTNDYANPELVKAFSENSAETISWLETLGVEFSLNQERSLYTHLSADGENTALTVIDAVYDKLKEMGVVVLFNTTADSLIEEEGAVVGVNATNENGEKIIFKSNAVLLATGGYGQNSEMVYEYNPELTGAITDEIAPTTGDGIIMAQNLGADVVDLDKVTTFPAVEVSTHQMVFPMYVPGDSIYVNSEGNRFVAEGFDDPATNEAILENSSVFVIFDQLHLDNSEGLQELYNRGAVSEGATIEELAEVIGVNSDNLKNAVDQWNIDFPTGVDSVFGRVDKMENDMTHAPYYAISIGIGVHYCLGGLVINSDTQVIDTEGNVISGLYAAGEVTGGVHGDTKIDGSTFADSMIFGYQSGIKASEFALTKGKIELVLPENTETNSSDITEQAEGNFVDGIYEGVGQGRAGEIKVTVTVVNKNITDITVVSHGETDTIFEGVETNLIPEIIKTQSTNVDVITGATLSSNGVIEAVNNALSENK